MRAPARSFLLFASVSLPAQAAPDLRERIEHFAADVADLRERHDVAMSATRRDRLRARFEQERRELAAIDFAALGRDARVDLVLLDNHVRREQLRLDDEQRRAAELAELVPYGPTIVALGEAQRAFEPVDAPAAAAAVAALAATVAQARDGTAEQAAATDPPHLQRAAEAVAALARTFDAWFRFRDGYDPLFSWWVRQPYRQAQEALDGHEAALRAQVAKAAGDATLVGDPIGEAALQRELAFEWIPYSPAELVALAEREFGWCDAEMAQASRALGCGDDWRKALELVKQRHRAPGEQPALIRELAHEAIAFLEARELITIPPLAKECWRMRMMSPEAQRVNPFFLGGQTIQVSFPTDAMTHDEKLQSLRSNNEHFCRATVHHELIPGHWLQQYSQARHRPYREPFGTPFWVEGWALYWEMRLYDLGLPHGPEDRVGMLYWRKHRCARIVFSLHFHLGQWSPRQCVDYLIERVGHEPAAAEAEVRRSIAGAYGPLYQAAYMLGGLQLRSLHGELVRPGSRWTERTFHDEVLRHNSIPIAALRAALREELPGRDLSGWRFADR